MDLSQNVIESPAHEVGVPKALSSHAQTTRYTIDLDPEVAELEDDGGAVACRHVEVVGVVPFHAEGATSSIVEDLVLVARDLHGGEQGRFVGDVEFDSEGRNRESSCLVDDERAVQLEI